MPDATTGGEVLSVGLTALRGGDRDSRDARLSLIYAVALAKLDYIKELAERLCEQSLCPVAERSRWGV